MRRMVQTSTACDPCRAGHPFSTGQRVGYSDLLRSAVVCLALALAISSCSAENSGEDGTPPSVNPGTSEAASSTGDATASVIDPQTLEVTAAIDIGVPSSGVAVSEDAVWILGLVGNRGRIVRIDPDTNEVTATIPVGNRPTALTASDDAVWVANTDDSTVSRIDPDSDEVIATVAVGEGPLAMAVSQDAVWVANSLDNTVSRIDPEDNEIAATVPVGDTPSAVAASQDAVWVVNTGDATITRVDPDLNRPTDSIPVESTSLFPYGSVEDKVVVFENDLWLAKLTGVVTRMPSSSTSIDIPIEDGVNSVTTSHDAVWVLSSYGSLSRIDPESNRVSHTIDIDYTPYVPENVSHIAGGVAVSLDSVWVTNLSGPIVVRASSPQG